MADVLTRGIEEARRLDKLLCDIERRPYRYEKRLFTNPVPKNLEDRVKFVDEVSETIKDLRKRVSSNIAYKPLTTLGRLELAEGELELLLKFKNFYNDNLPTRP